MCKVTVSKKYISINYVYKHLLGCIHVHNYVAEFVISKMITTRAITAKPNAADMLRPNAHLPYLLATSKSPLLVLSLLYM